MLTCNDKKYFFSDGEVDTVKTLSFFAQNEELTIAFIVNFIKKNSDAIDRLHSLLVDGDFPNAVILVHSIKGNAGYLGAEKLAKASLELEKELRSEQTANCLSVFKSALDLVLTSLQNFLKIDEDSANFMMKIPSDNDAIAMRAILNIVLDMSSRYSYIDDEIVREFKKLVVPFVPLERSSAILANIESFNHKQTRKSTEELIEYIGRA